MGSREVRGLFVCRVWLWVHQGPGARRPNQSMRGQGPRAGLTQVNVGSDVSFIVHEGRNDSFDRQIPPPSP